MKFSLHHPHTTHLEQIEEADNIRSSGLFLIPVDINRSGNFGCEGLTVDVNSFFSCRLSMNTFLLHWLIKSKLGKQPLIILRKLKLDTYWR
jgi:hypothetical protein